MRIDIVCASAGTGKTTELTRHIANAVAEGLARPDRILATTFSRRAAGELLEGARRTLLQRGLLDEAQALRTSLIGTVNSVCDRVIRAFAFELGISPDLRVIPEDEGQTLLAAALADVLIEEPYVSDARDAAILFGMDPGQWTSDVSRIVELARQNRIDADRLGESAARSFDGMLALLDPPDPRAAREVDHALECAIAEALDRLNESTCQEQKKTVDAITMLEQALASLRDGRLTWPERASLARVQPGKKHESAVEELIDEASKTMGHPALRRDIQRYVHAVFHFARLGLERYSAYKRDRRLLDFIDQEDLALTLLGDETCQGRLRDRIDLILVDEFQDTSPLQLAIFTRLRRFAPQSVWVGDPKQSIYGFRGADPVLMHSCVSRLASARYFLLRNYRSRPSLVRFVSTLFREAFGESMSDPREVALEAVRNDDGSAETLSLWLLQSANKAEDKAAVAAGIQAILQNPTMRVADPVSGCEREVVAADIAILCAQNDDVAEMSAALAALGISTAVSRGGLLSTREGFVALAALRILLDPWDRLAAGIVSYYTRPAQMSAEEWLSDAMLENPQPTHSAAQKRVISAAPAEALELAMDAIALAELCLKWGNSAQRLANLEQLRNLARAYEHTCVTRCVPATSAGLVMHLQQLAETGRDTQGRDASDAVSVLTCHASKGLEWPVVVLADLDRPFHPDPFDVQAMTSATGFDPEDPLRDRWIRLWLSPFGARNSLFAYNARGRSSEVGRLWAATDREQELRLLYVATTRARDHLVLTVRETPKGIAARWLQQARAHDGSPVLAFPESLNEGQMTWTVAGEPIPTRVSRWRPGGERAEDVTEGIWFADDSVRDAAPVEARIGARDLKLARKERAAIAALGAIEFEGTAERMKQARDPEMLGRAVHAFLAADRPHHSDRVALASAILERFGQKDVVGAQELVASSNRLKEFLDKRYSEALWHREVPVAYWNGSQEVHGIADLLLECSDGWIIVDHKTFVGPSIMWRAQAEAYIPQLEAYSRAVELATGRPVIGIWLHFPLAGGMLQVVRDRSAEASVV